MMRYFIGSVLALALGGCGITTDDIGRVPELSPIAPEAQYQTLGKGYMASQYPDPPRKYSTWDSRSAGLFTARRAMKPGDILTVNITIDDRASFDNKSDRARTQSKSIGLDGSTSSGLAGSAQGGLNSSTSFDGSGGTTRSESLNVSIAAIVSDILPNGNLIIRGSQEVVVNAEKRVLSVAGIVRPSDILPDSTIPYDRIAEARISYGGRGRITEVQQPTYGQQALDKFLPL
jgi:flagellar L-ring protein precursor FlgH